MNVAFFVHCFFPEHFYGTETYTLELALEYQRLGYRVNVITSVFPGEQRADNLITHFQYHNIPVIRIDKNQYPHTRVKDTYYQNEMRGVLSTVLRDIRPDIVHVTHLVNHTSVLLEVAEDLGIPTYATFTDFFGICLNSKLEDAKGRLCYGPSKSRLNCLVCHIHAASPSWSQSPSLRQLAMHPAGAAVAAYALQCLRRLPGVRHGPLDGLAEDIVRRPDILGTLYNRVYRGAVAPTKFLAHAYRSNGVNTPLHEIHFGVDVDRAPKPRRAHGHKPVIAYIGQIAPHKGVDLLVQAFARLEPGRAILKIFGPMDQDPHYMQTLRDSTEGSEVQFCSTFDKGRMATIFADIDLLVIPSRWYENSPLVLLNALATHTPVLVSDVPGMTEFIHENINGLSFTRGSVDALEEKLRKMTYRRETLPYMSTQTSYLHTPAAMAAKTAAIYG